ncbi:MAG: hypothetical protein JW778_04030 [Candidatus Altiarchaeota archaeon]|nr:hypothetical protein [Candidatus Altiarchaeota archaeon]
MKKVEFDERLTEIDTQFKKIVEDLEKLEFLFCDLVDSLTSLEAERHD